MLRKIKIIFMYFRIGKLSKRERLVEYARNGLLTFEEFDRKVARIILKEGLKDDISRY